MNELYHDELRHYQNFFQPVMKLASKERIGSKVKRKYDETKTPYQRLIESGQISEEVKKKLEGICLSLTPAKLKRSIDAKLAELYKAYEAKSGIQGVNPHKRLVPHLVTSYMMQQSLVGLPA